MASLEGWIAWTVSSLVNAWLRNCHAFQLPQRRSLLRHELAWRRLSPRPICGAPLHKSCAARRLPDSRTASWTGRGPASTRPASGRKGGRADRPNPTGRARRGSKYHLLVDACGLPLNVAVSTPTATTACSSNRSWIPCRRSGASAAATPPPPADPAARRQGQRRAAGASLPAPPRDRCPDRPHRPGLQRPTWTPPLGGRTHSRLTAVLQTPRAALRPHRYNDHFAGSTRRHPRLRPTTPAELMQRLLKGQALLLPGMNRCFSSSVGTGGRQPRPSESTRAAGSEDFYDDLAPEYDVLFADWWAAAQWHGEVISRVLPDRDVRPPATILDCTCGVGTQTLPLAALGYRMTGTDLSQPSSGPGGRRRHGVFRCYCTARTFARPARR
jgi:hypothetical protein